jgi:hypothetical protein
MAKFFVAEIHPGGILVILRSAALTPMLRRLTPLAER